MFRHQIYFALRMHTYTHKKQNVHVPFSNKSFSLSNSCVSKLAGGRDLEAGDSVRWCKSLKTAIRIPTVGPSIRSHTVGELVSKLSTMLSIHKKTLSLSWHQAWKQTERSKQFGRRPLSTMKWHMKTPALEDNVSELQQRWVHPQNDAKLSLENTVQGAVLQKNNSVGKVRSRSSFTMA